MQSRDGVDGEDAAECGCLGAAQAELLYNVARRGDLSAGGRPTCAAPSGVAPTYHTAPPEAGCRNGVPCIGVVLMEARRRHARVELGPDKGGRKSREVVRRHEGRTGALGIDGIARVRPVHRRRILGCIAVRRAGCRPVCDPGCIAGHVAGWVK
eukprot:scaffold8611_cov108-Isochrysis_galbana.AAC.7